MNLMTEGGEPSGVKLHLFERLSLNANIRTANPGKQRATIPAILDDLP